MYANYYLNGWNIVIMKSEIIVDIFDSGKKFWIKKRYPPRVEVGMFCGAVRFNKPYFYFRTFNTRDYGSIYLNKTLKFFRI